MGDLIKTPHSEVTATLEVLDRNGVTPDDFEALRKASSWFQSTIARVHKADPFLWALLEMEQTAKKAGLTKEDFLKLAKSEDKLRGIAALIRDANIDDVSIIDLDTNPYCPDGWEVVEHKEGGKIKWDIAKQADALYLSKNQQGGRVVKGNKLRKELADKPVLNASVLDYLLANPHLIPEEWKGKAVFFWGTIYRHSDGSLDVRYLDWGGGRWGWDWDVARLRLDWQLPCGVARKLSAWYLGSLVLFESLIL